jgi:hypothetical protein
MDTLSSLLRSTTESLPLYLGAYAERGFWMIKKRIFYAHAGHGRPDPNKDSATTVGVPHPRFSQVFILAIASRKISMEK